MSKSFTENLAANFRLGRLQKLTSYLSSGDATWKPFLEEFGGDATMEKLDTAAEDAEEGVLDNKVLRLGANYAKAIARDGKYAMAGRVFLLKHGHHNAFRELYEGAKIGSDNEEMWKDGNG